MVDSRDASHRRLIGRGGVAAPILQLSRGVAHEILGHHRNDAHTSLIDRYKTEGGRTVIEMDHSYQTIL